MYFITKLNDLSMNLHLPSNQCRCQATIQGQKSRRSYSIRKTWDHTSIFGLCSSGFWLKLELRLKQQMKVREMNDHGWMDGWMELHWLITKYLTLMYSIGQTQVASTAPAIHPAVIAVRGFFDFLVAMVATFKNHLWKQKPKTKLKSGLRVRPLIYNG